MLERCRKRQCCREPAVLADSTIGNNLKKKKGEKKCLKNVVGVSAVANRQCWRTRQKKRNMLKKKSSGVVVKVLDSLLLSLSNKKKKKIL